MRVTRQPFFQAQHGSQWSACRRMINFGAGWGHRMEIYILTPLASILHNSRPGSSRLQSKVLSSPSTSSIQTLLHTSIKAFRYQTEMAVKAIQNLKTFVANIVHSPKDHIDNDQMTVCWQCFVRNYKPHRGVCFNCGAPL